MWRSERGGCRSFFVAGKDFTMLLQNKWRSLDVYFLEIQKIVKNITKRKKKMKKSHQKDIKIKFNTLFDKNNLLND